MIGVIVGIVATFVATAIAAILQAVGDPHSLSLVMKLTPVVGCPVFIQSCEPLWILILPPFSSDPVPWWIGVAVGTCAPLLLVGRLLLVLLLLNIKFQPWVFDGVDLGLQSHD